MICGSHRRENGRNSSRLKSANNESSVGVMDGAHPSPFVCALRSPVSIVQETLLNMQSWMLAGHSRAERKKRIQKRVEIRWMFAQVEEKLKRPGSIFNSKTL